MNENLSIDSNIEFNSAVILLSKDEFGNEMSLNVDSVDDSDHNITGYSEQNVEGNSQYVVEIKQNEDDDEEEEKLEILLLDMDENTVWKDEEYNLNEEEENYLLSDDYFEHYPNNIGVSNSNNDSMPEDATDLPFIDSTITEDREKVYSGEIKSNAHNSNNVLSYVNKHEKDNNLANKELENIGNISTERTIQIILKDLRDYPDAKYKIPDSFSDIVEQEKNVNKHEKDNNLAMVTEKSTEKEVAHFAGSLEKANHEDLRQTGVEKTTETKFLYQTVPKIPEKIAEKENQSEICLEEKVTYSRSGLVCYTSEKIASNGTADMLGSKNKDISEKFSAYQQQDVEIKDLCTLPKFQPNQVATVKEANNFSEGKSLNKTSRYGPGSKFTEILNSTLYKEYNTMDFSDDLSAAHCSHCSNVVTDVNNATMPHSEIQSEKIDDKTVQKWAINFKTKTLLELFSLNNKIAKNIMSILSERFKTGALLIDILKYIRREMSLNITTKLKQDVRNFLEAAIDVGIVKMKYGHYVINNEKKFGRLKKST